MTLKNLLQFTGIRSIMEYLTNTPVARAHFMSNTGKTRAQEKVSQSILLNPWPFREPLKYFFETLLISPSLNWPAQICFSIVIYSPTGPHCCRLVNVSLFYLSFLFHSCRYLGLREEAAVCSKQFSLYSYFALKCKAGGFLLFMLLLLLLLCLFCCRWRNIPFKLNVQ